MDRFELQDLLRVALNDLIAFEPVDLARKWQGGELLIQPGNPELNPNRIPIENFFHKIVMVRDRLRVLEAKINSHPKLDDIERADLQQYITRVYGSLTTFNQLFADREDGFRGTGD